MDRAVLLEDVWKYFNSVPIIKGISLEIGVGELVYLVGPNGAGKTTLLKLIAGLELPDRGKVKVLELDTRSVRIQDLARYVGYVPQTPWYMFSEDSVEKELIFTCRNLGYSESLCLEKARTIARELGIEHLLSESPYTLSEGQARIIAIASALVHEPKVLLLDEPTSALDHVSKERLIDVIERIRSGRAIVIATHDLDLATRLKPSRIVVLYEGRKILDTDYRGFIEVLPSLESYGIVLPDTVKAMLWLLGSYGLSLDVDDAIDALYRDRDRVCTQITD